MQRLMKFVKSQMYRCSIQYIEKLAYFWREDAGGDVGKVHEVECVAVCCIVSQCVAVCCSVLPCVAVCCSARRCR